MSTTTQAIQRRVSTIARLAWTPRWRPFLASGGILLVIYLLTLQRIINGSSHDYMLDVGEMQVALNLWGTLHTTGYPLFILLGAPLVTLLKLLGIDPATAASTVSLLWSLAAAAILYDLLRRRTHNPRLSAALVLIFGLMESIWIHSVVAEVYSLYLLFAVLIMWWVLHDIRSAWTRRRWLVLAALFGFGTAHHRAIAYLAPALVVYLWPRFWLARRQMPLTLALGALLFLAGFLPYVYMPLYAGFGGVWNYEDPSTWQGFWSLFTGREAGWLWYLPGDPPQFGAHVAFILLTIARQLTLLGLLAGLFALASLFFLRDHPRRDATLLALWAATYTGFAFIFPRVVQAEAFLMPVYLVLTIALGEALARPLSFEPAYRWAASGVLLGILVTFVRTNAPLIYRLTRDPTGVQYVEQIATLDTDEASADTVLMVPWGPRYTAMAYGLYVTREYGGFQPVDHRGHFDQILARGDHLITTQEIFFTHPPGWWEAYVGQPIYLRAAGPGFVEIDTSPLTPTDIPPDARHDPIPLDNGVTLLGRHVEAVDDDQFRLTLYWTTDTPPDQSYSVYVHLTDDPSGGNVLTQADSAAPVSGWYPVTGWHPGEVIRDDYLVTVPAGVDAPLHLRVGMYRQLDDGSFANLDAFSQPLP